MSAAEPLPKPVRIPDGLWTEGENLRARSAAVLATFSSPFTTDRALARTRTELYALATAYQRLARRLPR